MQKALLFENVKISLGSIRSHKLRTILTMLIISFGIMALVGTLTAIDALKFSISKNFSMMGSNTFSIINRQMVVMGMDHRSKNYTNIEYNEAIQFKERFTFPGIISISTRASGTSVIKYENEKTNPNSTITGADQNYLKTAGSEIYIGRNFSPQEMSSGANVVIIGYSIYEDLFKYSDPIDKIISIGANKYRVIGVLKDKGNSMGMQAGRESYIPLTNVRQKYYRPNMNFNISFMTSNQQVLDIASQEATGLFRSIRKLGLGDEDNFSIMKSDSISQMLIENLKFVTIAAFVIAFITLLGASIGLMNIMLVSVSERTREIGVRKALGATNVMIKNQFLIETIVITELGGLLGIVFGMILANIVVFYAGGALIIPWLWIFVSLLVSLIVGLISGIFPAVRASKLNPIDALRFE